MRFCKRGQRRECVRERGRGRERERKGRRRKEQRERVEQQQPGRETILLLTDTSLAQRLYVQNSSSEY